MLDYIHSELDKPGYHVRTLLLDYSKAFDLVNHNILLGKLRNAGTPACLVRWCAAFLVERQQRVKIGSVVSPMVTMKAGTPQGTLLGPPAFIVHLGDFSTPDPIKDFIYVDDTSSCCSSKDPSSDTMQTGATYAAEWASTNDMRINATKTKEIVFTFSRNVDLPPLTIAGSVIESVSSSKFLGVTLSSNLSWTTHIEGVLGRCNQRLYLLYHLKRSGVCSRDLVIVYKSMVRPLLT